MPNWPTSSSCVMPSTVTGTTPYHHNDLKRLFMHSPLESDTVTANSLTCSTKRTIPSLSPPSRGKPADAAPDGQPLTAASLPECSGYLRCRPLRPKQLSTERGKTGDEIATSSFGLRFAARMLLLVFRSKHV